MAKPALDLDALKGLDAPLQLCLALGALAVARFLLGAVYAVYKYFLRPGKNLKKLGSWAVVTGATGEWGESSGVAGLASGTAASCLLL